MEIINLEQIKYFITIAETQALSRAADKLHISTAGLSKAIAELEAELGVKLFNRDHSGSHLTRSGKKLLPLARRISESVNTFQDVAKTEALGETPQLRVGFSNTAVQPELSLLLAQQHHSQGFRLVTAVYHTPRLLTQLKEGYLDLGLVIADKQVQRQFEKLAFVPIDIGHPTMYFDHQNALNHELSIKAPVITRQHFALFNDPLVMRVFHRLENAYGPLTQTVISRDPMTIYSAIVTANDITIALDWHVAHLSFRQFRNLSSMRLPARIGEDFVIGWLYNPDHHHAGLIKQLVRRLIQK